MGIHEEDHEILNFILDSITKAADESLEGFSCYRDDDYEEMFDDDDEEQKFGFYGRVKTWSITKGFNRANKQDLNKENITFKFTPIFGTVSISIGYNVSREFKVGFGPKNKDLKIKIMRLYHKIAAWEEVETPRRKREEFINNVVKTFPDLFDHLILGGDDDKEEEN